MSGTNGLAGSADAVLVLRRRRGKAAAELHVTGRDVEEAEYALDFDPRLGIWQLLDGPASDYALGDTRRTILDHLRAVGSDTPRQVAESLSLNKETSRRHASACSMTTSSTPTGQGRTSSTPLPVPHVPAVPEMSGDRDTGDMRDTL